ncbi:hypothetical protein SAMN05443669_101122 [Flavobacterium xanthum]|uniref:Uncharacterized protein n=1 Tax=Flavobacterium xanthum TaxID=69322 RepID=A0A1M7CE21_9FLAO|nr:hypothetical protein SAMN05443669_101122 [Flavobacterium xanthum]
MIYKLIGTLLKMPIFDQNYYASEIYFNFTTVAHVLHSASLFTL